MSKKIKWEDTGHKYSSVYITFGLGMIVRYIKDKNCFYWEFFNDFCDLKTGKSTTFEGAKKNATKAYQKYINENIAKCVKDN